TPLVSGNSDRGVYPWECWSSGRSRATRPAFTGSAGAAPAPPEMIIAGAVTSPGQYSLFEPGGVCSGRGGRGGGRPAGPGVGGRPGGGARRGGWGGGRRPPGAPPRGGGPPPTQARGPRPPLWGGGVGGGGGGTRPPGPGRPRRSPPAPAGARRARRRPRADP